MFRFYLAGTIYLIKPMKELQVGYSLLPKIFLNKNPCCQKYMSQNMDGKTSSRWRAGSVVFSSALEIWQNHLRHFTFLLLAYVVHICSKGHWMRFYLSFPQSLGIFLEICFMIHTYLHFYF